MSQRTSISLRSCYAVSGTDTPYHNQACAMSGTNSAYQAFVLIAPRVATKNGYQPYPSRHEILA
eukprot:3938320-Rhodomonas_salina.3